MSDRRLRELEREAAGGDLRAKVALLVERSRVPSTLTLKCSQVPYPKGNTVCKDGKAPLHDGRIHPHRAGPSMAIIGESDCWACDGSGRVCFEWEDRWALAAYCGDEAAHSLAGNRCPRCEGSGGDVVECSLCDGSGTANRIQSLHGWISGLSRWPGALMCAASASLALGPWYLSHHNEQHQKAAIRICAGEAGEEMVRDAIETALVEWVLGE